MAKPCPISRDAFLAQSKPIPVTFGTPGEPGTFTIYADPKEFSTGSFGFSFNGKQTILFGAKKEALALQIGLNVTAVGSKDAAKATKPVGNVPSQEDTDLQAAMEAAAAQVVK